MTDPLHILWYAIDAEECMFSADDVASSDGLTALQSLGILKQPENAIQISCPNCADRHVADIMTRKGPSETIIYYIQCPDSLYVEIPATLLAQWTINFDRLAQLLYDELKLSGHAHEVVPGRLWRLGKSKWQGADRTFYFWRGPTWDDARQIAVKIGGTGRPVILVADRAPANNVWVGKARPVVSLASVAALEGIELKIDAVQVAALVNEVDIAESEPKATTKLQKQVRAIIKDEATDEILVAAYIKHHSYRDAAIALSAERGVPVSKDQVGRAVNRAGGIRAVLRTVSSESVQRGVASHRRDKPRQS